MTGQGTGGKRPVFLNAKQIAERYGVSRTWPYNSPDIAHLRIKIGKRVLWKLEDLEAFEESCKDANSRAAILAKYKEWELAKKRKNLKFDLA